MTQHRFFVDEPLVLSSTVTLCGSQAKKAIRVLRKAIGDQLILFDGSGVEVTVEITRHTGSQVDCVVVSRTRPSREPSVEVVVGLALIRNSRFEIAVEKLTEVGVAKIVPLVASRNVVWIDEPDRWIKRKERLRSIAIQAAEQSGRVTIPYIADPTPLQAFVRDPECVVLVERSVALPFESIAFDTRVLIAVGPEGGWTSDEKTMIRESSAREASLGGLVLRSETAAIVAAASICQRAAVSWG